MKVIDADVFITSIDAQIKFFEEDQKNPIHSENMIAHIKAITMSLKAIKRAAESSARYVGETY